MPWTSQIKDLTTASTTGHVVNKPGVVGRTPTVTTIQFSPMEFFGAAARCSHLHHINPASVTAESIMISKLTEQHVDNTSAAFFVEPTVKQFKDYVGSYFAGTVAAGLCYLQMIREGYAWVDHFENFGGGFTGTKRKPDFVFAQPGTADLALVESKGTRSRSRNPFNVVVGDGYTGQVEPHLGHTIGGATATHGFCIGGWLTGPNTAELNIHFTGSPSSVAPQGTADNGGSPLSIRVGDISNALRLVHSNQLATKLRTRDVRPDDPLVRFSEIEWLNRSFLIGPPELTSCQCGAPPYRPPFVIDKGVAMAALAYSSRNSAALELSPMPLELVDAARADGGALFPDGFGVLSESWDGKRSIVAWSSSFQEFLSDDTSIARNAHYPFPTERPTSNVHTREMQQPAKYRVLNSGD